MKLISSVVVVISLALASTLAARNQAQAHSKPGSPAEKTAEDSRYPCRAVHTFDFWVGTFDATPWDQPTAPSRGELHNTREYEGCVIVERWTSAKGSGGMSMAFYDANRKNWRMIWNDDSNSSNDLEGTYSDGAMRFTGWVLDKDGKRLLVSNVLENVSPDTIRHIFSVSEDDGKTWVVKSDGRFRRRPVADSKQ
jgi:hypothetical protein